MTKMLKLTIFSHVSNNVYRYPILFIDQHFLIKIYKYPHKQIFNKYFFVLLFTKNTCIFLIL